MNKEIKDISCDVMNCIHHNTNNRCTAEHIKVGNLNAKSTKETNCETFKCNNSCTSN